MSNWKSPEPCTICGDTEPSHVHANGERIEDYFTVGRCESELQAATRWKERALKAERERAGAYTWSSRPADEPPAECSPRKHDWYVHEYNTPCYGHNGEIYLPAGTVHCRSCFKVKGARKAAPSPA